MECYSKCLRFGSVAPDEAEAAPSRISAKRLSKAFRGYRLHDGPGSFLSLIKARSHALRPLPKISRHEQTVRAWRRVCG